MSGASGGGPPPHRKAWGPASSSSSRVSAPGGPSYSSITSINTSARDSKNILEVRLERQEGSTFNLTMGETENLLRRLNIDGSHVIGASACQEGRPVVLITLHPSVDITRFLYRNESYVVKEGVRTTIIRPEGKKEKVVKITGLHPNTKDQAVVKYLAAHGTVSTVDKIIHHVFPGEPGSSLLAGKLNGNRSYMVDLKVPMGSYHIIDGEKVSVRYAGQEWTCARCQQFKRDCPGKAVAKECTADRVLLSTYMTQHWQKIGYKPETDDQNEVDGEAGELDIQVGGKSKETFVIAESSLASKYSSVIVKGFRNDTPLSNIKEVLLENGLSEQYMEEDMTRNEKTGAMTVNNLKPEECLALVEKMHRKRFLNRQIFVSCVVAESPVKTSTNPDQHGNESLPVLPPNPVFVDPKTGAMNKQQVLNTSQNLDPDPLHGLTFGLVSPGTAVRDKIKDIEGLNKRKSENSPEVSALSRKEKKIMREEDKRLKKLERKKELKGGRGTSVSTTP